MYIIKINNLNEEIPNIIIPINVITYIEKLLFFSSFCILFINTVPTIITHGNEKTAINITKTLNKKNIIFNIY